MGLDRELRSFNSRMCKLTTSIGEGLLAASVANGAPLALSLGRLLPNAVLLGRAVKIASYFTGGGATAVTVQIGTQADPDAVMAALNVFDTTLLNTWLQGTAGVSPIGPLAGIGGIELFATLTPDAGHNLAALTAGALDVELYCAEPDRVPGQF